MIEPSEPARGLFVADSAWPAVEAALATGAVALLPVGAASKEHGRHLPMNTDLRQAEWIADALVARLNVVAWPPVTYGYYPVFVDFPGSISVARETFAAFVADILTGIRRAGAAECVVLNTGISTIAPLEEVSARFGARVVNVYSGPRFEAAVAAVSEQSWGGHADEIETSLMLAIDAARVCMAAAAPAPVRIERGLFNREDPHAPNYSPDGVNGDPTLATAAKGARLLAALLEDVVAAIAPVV